MGVAEFNWMRMNGYIKPPYSIFKPYKVGDLATCNCNETGRKIQGIVTKIVRDSDCRLDQRYFMKELKTNHDILVYEHAYKFEREN